MTSTNIFAFWKTSLQVFTNPDQRKNFILGTLSLLRRGVITLMKLFWWLPIIYVASLTLPTLNLLFFLSINTVTFYLMIMSLRPSTEIKNYAYFYRYAKALLIMLGVNLCIVLVPTASLLLAPEILFLLFYLESDLSMNSALLSVKKAFSVLLFCFPTLMFLCVPYSVMSAIILILLYKGPLGLILFAPLQFLLSFLVLAATTTYYLKLKHEHYNLFFE